MPTLGELVRDKPTHIVKVGQTIKEVVDYMVTNNVGAVPILDGDKLAGISVTCL